MISRTALALTGALGFAALPSAHAQTNALGNAAALSEKPSAPAAGPNQLFPPLPSLASLPPSAAEQIEDAPAVSGGHRSGKGKSRRAPLHRAMAETSVRMVVSDESQAYLTEVDRKLDEALRNTAREGHAGADAVSVAWTR